MRNSKYSTPYIQGTLTGVAVHLAFMLQAYLDSTGFSYFGITDKQLSTTILEEYLGVIAAMFGVISSSHLLVGAAMGLAAGRTLHLFEKKTGTKSTTGRILFVAGLLVLLHILLLARSMAHYPQLYVEAFHGRGGWFAVFQDRVCLSAGPMFWNFLLAAILFFWLVAEARALLAHRHSISNAAGLVAALLLLATTALHPALRDRFSGDPFTIFSTGSATEKKIGTADSPPNILLLAVDSLRSDRVFPAAAAGTAAAPAMSRLAREGTSFTAAYSVLPRTFPAWVSMLTGLYPSRHGIGHMFPAAADRNSLPPAVPELLAVNGYATAVLTDFAGDMFSRVDLGFQHVEAPYFHFPTLIKQRMLELDYHLLPYVANRIGRKIFPVLEEFAHNADPRLLTGKTLDVLDKLPEPWLVLVFYSTPHFPYAAPWPYYHRFASTDYRGAFRYHKLHDLAAKIQTEDDIQQVRALYDGSVRAVDDQIDHLLKRLTTRAPETMDNTVVIVTADHGENLYEGELGMGHGDHLLGEHSVRVPLIFWSTGDFFPAGLQIAAPTPNITLAPTILDLAGLHPDSVPQMDGRSLKRLWLPSSGPENQAPSPGVLLESGIWFSDDFTLPHRQQRIHYPPLTELAEIDRGTNHEIVLKKSYSPLVEFAKQRALYQEGRKILYTPSPEGVRWQMFDPVTDPLNDLDLLQQEPELASRLQNNLLTMLEDTQSLSLRHGYLIPHRQPGLSFPPSSQSPWMQQLPGHDLVQP